MDIPRPHVIRVGFAGETAELVHYRLGSASCPEKSVLVMSGVHGREHGGIQISYELVQRLAAGPLLGQVDVLPVCNPMAFAAETRFTPGSERDMSRSFGRHPPTDLVEALARAVLELASGASVVLNLHSAGEARYLPHAIYYRNRDAEWAAEFGLSFIIKRAALDALPGHIAVFLEPSQRTVTLELGGGLVALRDDVELGLDVILALLRRMGVLQAGEIGPVPTPRAKRYDHDARHFVRALGEGAFYPSIEVGAEVQAGDPFGFWVPVRGLAPRAAVAPITGQLIYLRTRHRTPEGATLAMLLPQQIT